jgi:hypothetical protein
MWIDPLDTRDRPLERNRLIRIELQRKRMMGGDGQRDRKHYCDED